MERFPLAKFGCQDTFPLLLLQNSVESVEKSVESVEKIRIPVLTQFLWYFFTNSAVKRRKNLKSVIFIYLFLTRQWTIRPNDSTGSRFLTSLVPVKQCCLKSGADTIKITGSSHQHKKSCNPPPLTKCHPQKL